MAARAVAVGGRGGGGLKGGRMTRLAGTRAEHRTLELMRLMATVAIQSLTVNEAANADFGMTAFAAE